MTRDWQLSEIWNQSFETVPEEKIKKRNYLYASELGNSCIEIFYKLKGEPYTNTFSAANRRKMEAGKLFEAIVRYVLKRAGILKKSQQEANCQIPGCLEVHGRLDFIAGGQIDIAQAEECNGLTKILFDELEFPRIYLDIANQTFEMVKRLAGQKNDTLQVYVLELKSVSDFVYRLIENATRPLNFHHQQGFHYLYALKMKVGKVGYINRDDVRIMEKKIENNAESYKSYAAWIEMMSDYVISNTVPPKEPLVLFHRDTCTFNKNTMGVEWCKYLTKIYGYADPQAFRNDMEDRVKKWNYTYSRCVDCKEMTDENMRQITEARKMFPEWDNLVDLGKLRKAKKERVA